MRGIRNAVVALIAAIAITAPSGVRSAGVEDFYKGRTISLIIGYSVGSGYDIYARLLARFIGKHIPGRPAVVAQNMPGAGSIKAAMYLHGVAPKDGSVIATIGRSAPLEPRNSTAAASPGSAALPAIRASAPPGTRRRSRPGRTR
jgi:tripartite-type tricarboxylate transporter receptor subunit TctC